jgi:pimeloyl-ACP methyl ester carboxylesterase
MPSSVILIPGLDGTGLLFYRQVPALERRYRVLVHRLRDDARHMTELVADLHQAVLASGADPVTLVGESFGGALSLSYALAHPESVSRLVVLNSFPYYSPRARLALGYHLLRVTPWGVMPLVRQLTAWRMHSPHTGRDEIRRFHHLMRATTRGGYLSRLRMLREYDVRHRLSELTMPVLYLAADRDRLVPAVSQAKLMASATKQSAVRVLEGHGHICLIAPDLDLESIVTLWSEAEPRDAASRGPVTASSSWRSSLAEAPDDTRPSRY